MTSTPPTLHITGELALVFVVGAIAFLVLWWCRSDGES